MSDTPEKKRKEMRDWIRYTGLGFEILACILIFAGLGYGLDRWLQTDKPWFLLGLSLTGCAAAMYLMIRTTK
ncbi:MAG: hypothetical protein OHK0039_14150 [Bacteroidia bacterium]